MHDSQITVPTRSPGWISPFSPAKDLHQENYNFRKPAKSTKFLKHTHSARPPICRLLIFYAKNSFVLRQVAMLFAKDLELMGIGIQSGSFMIDLVTSYAQLA
jgi:hypothetical protein